VLSEASNIDEIIEELEHTTEGEREGRAQDKEEVNAMQKLRSLGYM
jgi:sulfate adenylyltransferase subunit 2